MKMNSASILLNGGMVDYGFFKIIIASENGYEPRAFPQEGIIWTMEKISKQSSNSFAIITNSR